MTTGRALAARTVSHRLDTLWDLDYEPTSAELESLYETAKKAPVERCDSDRLEPSRGSGRSRPEPRR
jgi:hypothetical protein